MLQLASKIFKFTDVRMLLTMGLPAVGLSGSSSDSSLSSPDEQPDAPVNEPPQEQPADREWEMISIQIPGHVVHMLKGMKRKKLTEIQWSTKTLITLPNGKGPGLMFCKIEGYIENCERAKETIMKLVEEHSPVETEVLLVKKIACGYIIGVQGNLLHFLRVSSNAIVTIRDPKPDEDPGVAVVTISGTKRQVEAAKFLLTEILIRTKRRLGYSLQLGEEAADDPMIDVNKGVEGFGSVSAFVDPKHVYIQKSGGSKAKAELEILMERYYTCTRIANLRFDKMEIGTFAAAQYGLSEVWSRCRVAEIIKDDANPGQSLIRLIFIDSGEAEYKCLSDVKRLIPNFFKMPAIAAQCALKNPRNGDWPSVSFETFDTLVPVAKDYEITVKIVGKETNIFGQEIPVIEIIDHQSLGETNIVEALEKIVYE